MIGTGERVLPGGSRNVYFQLFLLANAFFTYLNTINLNIFHNNDGIYRFVRKFNKIYEEMKAK